MWRIVALCSVVGCFHPSPVAGIPCSEGLHCPGDQVCDTRQEPPICVEHLGDAGADATDSPGAGDDATDAPQALGCAADSECTGGVCHEMTGQCIPDAEVLFVATTGQDNAQCSRALPCASLSNAFSRATATRRTIAVADGLYNGGITNFHAPGMALPLLISGSHTGWDGAMLKMALIVDGPLVTIEGVTVVGASQTGIDNRSTTTLSRVLVSGGSNDCVDNDGDKLTVLDSWLDSCARLGITSTAELDVERTIITNNKGGGIAVMAKSTIINNVLAKNGQIAAGSVGGALLAAAVGQVTFRFNTVAANQTFDPQVAPGVHCSTAAMVEDSIIANNSALVVPQISPACSAKYSLFDANAPAGTGNLTGAPMFVNANDYHLQVGSPAIDKADPAATESVDVEGGHRPTGAARDIGADEQP